MIDQRRSVFVCLASLGLVSTLALAGPVPDYDFDWATIGALGNKGLDLGPADAPLRGRGSVDHRYRISKLEITTNQWMEFVNTFSTQGDEHRRFGEPLNWGAEVDPTYQGPGRQWRLRNVANAQRLPVSALTWREAAQYCNWLHNGKQSTFESLATGAYDTSTWGGNARDGFTDEERHLPGAKFWIPTMDEWLKAAYYDPNKNGTGDGGWWLHPNGSDTPLISGWPDEGGETSGGIYTAGFPEEWNIPLGAYEHVVSPWGLWDISGGTDEWTESYNGEVQIDRLILGSYAGFPGWQWADQAWTFGAGVPDSSGNSTGFRIASIPTPPTAAIAVVGMMATIPRSRRAETCIAK